ncbi:MAG: FUSC family protein [Janthinobacterium lividum]
MQTTGGSAPERLSAKPIVDWLKELPGRLPSLPPGWFGFCTRTWIAIVLALASAFWLELDSADSAAVCAAILAQPTRGQSLSKAIYRMGGTVIGAVVALLLVGLFPQDRFMLLGGVGLWVAICTTVSTMTRDFRAYAAVLSGYTVSIVAIAVIDNPNGAFAGAASRVAVIAIGIVAMTLVNDAFGSPETWKQLLGGLKQSAEKVFAIADDAVHGRALPAEAEIAGLALSILALSTQANYSRTELQDGQHRIAGADSAMLGLLDMLFCARAIAYGVHRDDVDPAVVERLALLAQARSDDEALDGVEFPHDPVDAFLIERTVALARNKRLVEDGMGVLTDGGRPKRYVHLEYHLDYFAAGLNATRILIAFAIGAAFSILSGLSDSTLALIQISAMCALAATNPNPTSFAYGVLIGAPLAIVAAGFINFFALTHGFAMPVLAISILPAVFIACTLVMYPKTGSIGFIMLVFTFVMLNPANSQSFDLTSFAERAIMFLSAAVIVFLSLVLILPVSPRRRVMRGMLAIARDIEREMDGPAQHEGPALASRQYDRLAQMHQWNGRIGSSGSRRFVLARLIGLTDLVGALGRARAGLDGIDAVEPLRDIVRAIGAGLRKNDIDGTLHRMDDGARTLLDQGKSIPAMYRPAMLRAVSGLYGASAALRANRRMLLLTGTVRISRSSEAT